MSESIRHWGKYRPGSPAVYHNAKVITFRELDALANIVANKIESQGIKNKRVGIAVRSKLNLLVSIIGVLRASKSAVILNTGLPIDALQINITDTQLSALIFDHDQASLARLPVFEKDSLLNVGDATLSVDPDARSYHFRTVRQPADEWGVVFSSGTTGVPKGIERDHNSMITELLGWCIELQLNRNTIFYIGRPIHYTGGLVLSLATLLVGGAICINDFKRDDDPEEIWKDYQDVLSARSLTWAFFVPDQLRSFIRIAETNGGPLAAAQTVLVMGAPISADEKIKAARTLGSQIVESWGNSESLGTITDPDDLKVRPKSIGRPFLSDELFILDDSGNLLQPGQIGRIAGSEVAGFFGYSNRPAETEHVKRNDMIISDDIGFEDADGYFYICGRDQDCVLVKGQTVYLVDIETRIRDNEKIKECSVVAKPVKEGLLSLVAVVVLVPSTKTTANALRREVNTMLPAHQTLHRVIIVESIPYLPSGKKDKVWVNNFVKDAP